MAAPTLMDLRSCHPCKRRSVLDLSIFTCIPSKTLPYTCMPPNTKSRTLAAQSRQATSKNPMDPDSHSPPRSRTMNAYLNPATHRPLTMATTLFLLTLLLTSLNLSIASLYVPPPTTLTYHHGALLEGNIPASILWYGKFSASQKAIISDFLLSLTPANRRPGLGGPPVSRWWGTVDEYLRMAGRARTRIVLESQVEDEDCSIGKSLTRNQISQLAAWTMMSKDSGGVALILTSEDVTVESFCMSNCGLHSSHNFRTKKWAYIWAGNSAQQCPGQCAWPFHQPIYGPQAAPLVSPNGDMGMDGMVINIAALLAGAVTNPFGGGFFQGEPGAGVGVAAVCAGVYGRGAYPGYAGEVKVDRTNGGSYNVVGVNGRKYLVPAMFDPLSKSCAPMV